MRSRITPFVVVAAFAAVVFQAAGADDYGRKSPKEQPAPKQTVSPKVGEALRAAQDAMQKQDWDGAYARIRDAQGVANRTAYDDFQIAEMLGYLEIKRQHYPEAAAAFEASVGSGFLPPGETLDRLTLLAQLHLQLKNYPKAVDYAQKALAAGKSDDPAMDALIGQAQYLDGKYREAAEAMARAAQKAGKAGKPIQENWLQVELSGYGQLKDEAGVIAALQQLAIAFPQKDYLEDLFSRWKRAKGDDRAVLHLYRLMFELGKLDNSDDYLNMAQLAMEQGLPGEAVEVIQRGQAKHVFSDEVSEVQARRALDAAKAKSVADRKALQELEAHPARSGEESVQLGIAHASYQENAKALDFLKAGLAQGALKRPDEAHIVLGQVQLKIHNNADSQAAFAAVDDSAKLAVIARLWQVYTRTAGS